jgi:hypothetical protein
MGWIPFTYVSEIERIAAKPFSQTLYTVNSSNYIWFTVILAIFAVITVTIGAILIFKRKKARAINKISGK